jgi:hypothetical protein
MRSVMKSVQLVLARQDPKEQYLFLGNRHVTRIPRGLASFLSKSEDPEPLVSLGDNMGFALFEANSRRQRPPNW